MRKTIQHSRGAAQHDRGRRAAAPAAPASGTVAANFSATRRMRSIWPRSDSSDAAAASLDRTSMIQSAAFAAGRVVATRCRALTAPEREPPYLGRGGARE